MRAAAASQPVRAPAGFTTPGAPSTLARPVALTEEQLAQDLTAAMKARDMRSASTCCAAWSRRRRTSRSSGAAPRARRGRARAGRAQARSASARRPRSSRSRRDATTWSTQNRAERAMLEAYVPAQLGRGRARARHPRRARRRRRRASMGAVMAALRERYRRPLRRQGRRARSRAGCSPSRAADRSDAMELPVLARLKKELADLKHELTFELPKELAGRGGARRPVGERRVRGREAPAGLRPLAHRAARRPHPRALDVHRRVDPARRRRVRQPRDARRRRRRRRRAGRLRDRLPRGGRRRRAGQISLSSPIGRALREQGGRRRGRGADAERPAHVPDRRAGHVPRAARAAASRAESAQAGSASRRRRAASSGATGFEKIPVAHSMPSSWPRWGTISQCQWNSARSLPSSAPAWRATL